MALPIEDYALDRRPRHRRTGRQGRLDRLAVPAALRLPRLLRRAARRPNNGRWLLAPADRGGRRRLGATSTAPRLLETTFTTADGELVLLDVMPTGTAAPDVVRRLHLHARHGADPARLGGALRLRPRPAVGEPRAGARRRGDRRGGRSRQARAARSAAPDGDEATTPTSSRSTAGDEVTFSTTWVRSWRDTPGRSASTSGSTPRPRAEREWSARCREDVPHADMVRRSLLTLLLMTHARDRRHRRGADHVAARGLRWRAQLGLPLLLAARRGPDARVAARRRLRRRRRCTGAAGC